MNKAQQEREQTHQYYAKVLELLRAHKYSSILDVGCGYSGIIMQTDIPDKTAIDLWTVPSMPGVTCIHGDFLTYQFNRTFDVVICLQVLEHIPEVSQAITRLFSLSRASVIVSLPYMWPRGMQPGHIHDPIDDAKITAWFKDRPHTLLVCDIPQRVVIQF